MFILPVVKDRRTRRPPWLTWSLLGFNTLVFFASVAAGLDNVLYDHGFRPGAPMPSAFAASLFLHGGFFHLFGNMLFLWSFGVAVEDSLGAAGLALVYFLTHAFAMLAHTLTHPHSLVPVVGASGAISGILGVYAFLFGAKRLDLHVFLGVFRVGKIEASALAAILAWMLWQLFWALWEWRHPGPGEVAYWAHLGGIGVGFILGFLFQGLGFPRRPAAP